ncbi:Ras association domain-containing protein 5 [Oopsacas minuta]|uniref:Ras association domain-containing protein 5 n=1 Tax=Oopsacas minuta TaxID=111878 RepID=A0AAV7K4P8_9METZ|nr:Ras association domain-containing protein 5 [Oopsacas minuta]
MISRAKHKVVKKTRSKLSGNFEMKTVKKSSESMPIHTDADPADMPFTSASKRARTLSRMTKQKKAAVTVGPRDLNIAQESIFTNDTVEDLRIPIEKYNMSSDESFRIKIENNLAQGFVPVHLCIDGNLNVMPPTGVGMVWSSLHILSDILIEDEIEMRGQNHTEKVTFERDAKTFVNIDNHTMAFEAIALLIRKLFIVENPADFIFYEHLHGITRKVKDTELPLINMVRCSDRSDWKLILKRKPFDDQIGQWSPFTIPELRMFLDMADFEREMKETNLRNLYEEVRILLLEEIGRKKQLEEEVSLVRMRKKSVQS